MSPPEEALRRTAADLGSLGVDWALVGGLAVSVRTEPRFTRDVDVAVATADDASAEALVAALVSRGYRPLATLEQTAAQRLSTVRLRPPQQVEPAELLDLLFASSGIEPEIVATADEIEVLPALHVRVARTEHLIALKVLARDDLRRPQDLVDLRMLLREASPAELVLARAALTLVGQRGFSRDKDLIAELDELIRTQPRE